MIKTEVRMEPTGYIESIICDICKKEYDDVMDLQEFINIRHTGGYSSVFGDGHTVTLDMCQTCFKEHLDEFIQDDFED